MANRHDAAVRVAVTGSTGMIGSHLVAELVRAGYSDIVLPVRDKSRVANIHKTMSALEVDFSNDIFTIVEADIKNSESLTKVFEGVDTVFHCAASIMVGDMTEQELVDNNVSLARSVANAAMAAGVRRIVHTSSIVVFAPSKAKGQSIDESNEEHGDEESGAYGRSKYLSDVEMKRVVENGVELITLYPAVVLGEGDWSLNGSSAIIPLIAKGLPIYTKGVMSYVDVRDVARAYITVASDTDGKGGRFIVSAKTLSYQELLTLGAKAAGKRAPFIRVGKCLLFSVYYILKFAMAIRLTKDRNIKKRKFESVLYGNSYSGAKLERELGFRYTPIEESIDRVVKAYLREKRG